jgi:hypothetical protein
VDDGRGGGGDDNLTHRLGQENPSSCCRADDLLAAIGIDAKHTQQLYGWPGRGEPIHRTCRRDEMAASRIGRIVFGDTSDKKKVTWSNRAVVVRART